MRIPGCPTCCGFRNAGGDLLFRTSGTWPRVKALYCYPIGLDEWPTDAVIVERLPLRSCQRRGAAIDVILQPSPG